MPHDNDLYHPIDAVPGERSTTPTVALAEPRRNDVIDYPIADLQPLGPATLPPEDETKQAIFEELQADPPLAWLTNWLKEPLVWGFLIGMLGLIGVFLFNQVASTLLWIGSLSPIGQYLGYSLLGLLGILIFVGFGQFAFRMLGLRKSPRWKMSGFTALQARQDLNQSLVHQQYDKVRAGLKTYMEEFPLERGHREYKYLVQLGFAELTMKQLSKRRDHLMDGSNFSNTTSWLEDFQKQFQAEVDQVAAARIHHWAKRNALLTTLSNQSSIDTLGTLYFSMKMFNDLCAIYQLRAGRIESMILLSRIFFQSYLAGQMNQVEQITADKLTEIMGSAIMGKISSKAAEAAANYGMMYYLGKHIQKLLMPVSK